MQGKNVNKNLDKTRPEMLSNKANSTVFAAIFLFLFFLAALYVGVGVSKWLPPQVSKQPRIREAPVRFGYGLGVERFERFRFSVPAVPLQKGFVWQLQYSFTGKDGSSSGFGSWKTVPAVPVPLSVSWKTVPTVPVSVSGSVPEPPWRMPKSA